MAGVLPELFGMDTLDQCHLQEAGQRSIPIEESRMRKKKKKTNDRCAATLFCRSIIHRPICRFYWPIFLFLFLFLFGVVDYLQRRLG